MYTERVKVFEMDILIVWTIRGRKTVYRIRMSAVRAILGDDYDPFEETRVCKIIQFDKDAVGRALCLGLVSHIYFLLSF